MDYYYAIILGETNYKSNYLSKKRKILLVSGDCGNFNWFDCYLPIFKWKYDFISFFLFIFDLNHYNEIGNAILRTKSINKDIDSPPSLPLT